MRNQINQKRGLGFFKFVLFIFISTIFNVVYAQFDISYSPPTLINPTEVVLTKNSSTVNIVKYGFCGPGKVYSLSFADDEDALVTFGGNEALSYPVHIAGGRNVIIRGLEIVIQTQPGNEIGTVTLTDQTYNQTNPHPVVPACGGLRLNVKQSATHWVEGLHLDMMGHDADGIIVNSDSNFINSKVVIQNSLIEGIEGNMNLHGDILQTQTGHLKNLIFENVTMKQSLEGVVLSFPVDNVEMRNINYDTDSRFDSDDAWDDLIVGGFFVGTSVLTYSIENIYIKYKNPETDLWFIIKDKHFTSPERAGQVVYGVTTESHPEVHFKESPPGGDFALASQVGINYNSVLTTNEYYIGDIDVYPNPVNNSQINIKTYDNIVVNNINIYDMSGKRVFTKNFDSFKSNILLKPNLSTGIYVIKLNTSGKGSISKKIIIE